MPLLRCGHGSFTDQIFGSLACVGTCSTWPRAIFTSAGSSVHTVRGSELRALRRLQREQASPSPYLFTTERRTPMSAAGFRKQLAVIGVAADLPFPVHPHMLRHACGFALANGRHDTRAIQEWLGHRNIQHTTHRFSGSDRRSTTANLVPNGVGSLVRLGQGRFVS